MPRSIPALALCLLLWGAPGLSTAAADDPVAKKPTLGEAMAEVRTTATEGIEELEKSYATAASREQKHALKQQISQLKFDLEVDLLRVQLKYAVENQDTALAAQLQTAIDRMLNPPDLNDPDAQRKSRERQPLPRDGEGSK